MYNVQCVNVNVSISISTQTITIMVITDHATCEDRKSVYCYMFMLAGGPITCKSGFSDRRRVSGTAESEVRGVHATKEACRRLKYMIKLFKELNLPTIV